MALKLDTKTWWVNRWWRRPFNPRQILDYLVDCTMWHHCSSESSPFMVTLKTLLAPQSRCLVFFCCAQSTKINCAWLRVHAYNERTLRLDLRVLTFTVLSLCFIYGRILVGIIISGKSVFSSGTITGNAWSESWSCGPPWRAPFWRNTGG
jgi:hypothetical protein